MISKEYCDMLSLQLLYMYIENNSLTPPSLFFSFLFFLYKIIP